jgi:hypothetical protein
MKKKSMVFGVLIFIPCFLICQSKNMIIVKKGVVTLSSKKIISGQIEILKNTDTIKLSPASLVFVTNNKKLIELSPSKTYAPKEINKLFAISKTSFNDDFIKLIMNQHYYIKDKVGSTSRGAEENWDYFPNDGFKAIENTIYLKINQNTNKLYTDIKLYKLGEHDTLTLKVSDLPKGIKLDRPGEYHWKYTAKAGIKVGIYDNNFIVPSINEQKQLKNAFDNYKNTISNFTLEMQEQLMQEYLLVNKLF